MTHNAEGGWLSPWVLSTPAPCEKNQRLKGDLYLWCRTGLGQGQCGQRVVTSLTLLMPSVLVSEVQGLLQPQPCVLGFSQWCFTLE